MIPKLIVNQCKSRWFHYFISITLRNQQLLHHDALKQKNAIASLNNSFVRQEHYYTADVLVEPVAVLTGDLWMNISAATIDGS